MKHSSTGVAFKSIILESHCSGSISWAGYAQWATQIGHFVAHERTVEDLVCRTPVWLKTAFTVLVQEGGVLVHGCCAEKENRGKGGSGKGKIGAGVGSCQSMDPVRIPSGPSRAPIFAFLGTAFGQSGSSRDPVGHQCREAAKFIKNNIFAVFLHVFRWFWLLPDRSKRGAKNSKLVPDWIPTGQKRCPKMQKLVPDWVPTGSRLGPDWIPTRFLQKNTYFLKFEHLFLKF